MFTKTQDNCAQLAGIYNTTVVENSMEGPQKIQRELPYMIQESHYGVYSPNNENQASQNVFVNPSSWKHNLQ